MFYVLRIIKTALLVVIVLTLNSLGGESLATALGAENCSDGLKNEIKKEVSVLLSANVSTVFALEELLKLSKDLNEGEVLQRAMTLYQLYLEMGNDVFIPARSNKFSFSTEGFTPRASSSFMNYTIRVFDDRYQVLQKLIKRSSIKSFAEFMNQALALYESYSFSQITQIPLPGFEGVTIQF